MGLFGNWAVMSWLLIELGNARGVAAHARPRSLAWLVHGFSLVTREGPRRYARVGSPGATQELDDEVEKLG